MQSLGDILSKRDFSEPTEIASLRNYINERYGSACIIRTTQQNLIVTVESAALASVLRMEQESLQVRCGTDKKIVIRIGSVK